jgi:hypothetical protein
MSALIDTILALPAMLGAPRGIVLVAVAWSPWHQRSRPLLAALESSQADWSPGRPVHFFELWPEKDSDLYQWYEALARRSVPRFELHGHGYAPFWWLRQGDVIDCLSKPYQADLAVLQQRSANAFQGNA